MPGAILSSGVAVPMSRPADFADTSCVLALDLATRVDMAAMVQLFYHEEDDGRLHYYVFPRFWLPESALDTSKNASQYLGWQSQGLLELMDDEQRR